MTAPADRTVAHGGGRRGDFLEVSPAEMRRCHRLIDMETRLLALTAGAESAHTSVSTVDLRTAIGGAA